jgi:hypothetical protein
LGDAITEVIPEALSPHPEAALPVLSPVTLWLKHKHINSRLLYNMKDNIKHEPFAVLYLSGVCIVCNIADDG